ncbi:hypothetical protein D3C85_1114450 [compost metagenome]
MYNAEDIKLFSLNFIPQYFGGAISFEVPFLNGSRRADVLLSNQEELISFEIKSDADSLSTLKEQLSDYKRCFNSTYVICGEKHLKKIQGNKCIDAGVILFKDGLFYPIRRARKRVRLDTRARLAMCDISFLRKMSSKKTKNDMIDEIVSGPHKVTEIEFAITQHISSRITNVYSLYMRQREQLNNYEKLMMLSLRRHLISFI